MSTRDNFGTSKIRFGFHQNILKRKYDMVWGWSFFVLPHSPDVNNAQKP